MTFRQRRILLVAKLCRWRVLIFLTILVSLLYTSYLLTKGYLDDSSITDSFYRNNDGENLEYAVVIDAGSSGSRVHIYNWPPHSGNPSHLLDIHQVTDSFGRPLVKKILPGLSSYSNEPHKATDYLYPLLQFAAEHVPTSKHKETPLFILATAGMRLLSKNAQEVILNNLQQNIPQNTSFHFPPSNVEIISGKQEGIYSWIAVNYLLRRFHHSSEINGEYATLKMNKLPNSSSTFKLHTVGMLEMGGASLQVAYDVTDDHNIMKHQDTTLKSNLAEFNLGCMDHDTEHTYRIFVSTLLGFGANRVRKLYSEDLVYFQLDKSAKENRTMPSIIFDPCLSKDATEMISKETKKSSDVSANVLLKGTGKFNECYKKIIPYLNLTCEQKQCEANSIIKPSLNFSERAFYGFSEFWYTMEDVLRIGGKYNYQQFQKAAKDYCSTRWSTLLNRFHQGVYTLADRKRLQYQCFKSAWMSVVLHEGLKVPVNYGGLRSASVITGQHAHWSLGALLYRTRYFPLRTSHRSIGQYSTIGGWYSMGFYQILFYACIAIVATIIVYLCILQRIYHPSSYVPLTSINSLESGFTLVEQPLLWR